MARWEWEIRCGQNWHGRANKRLEAMPSGMFAFLRLKRRCTIHSAAVQLMSLLRTLYNTYRMAECSGAYQSLDKHLLGAADELAPKGGGLLGHCDVRIA